MSKKLGLTPEQRDNVRDKLEAFNEASLEIKDYAPKILRRNDNYNIITYIEKISKTSGEKYQGETSYYGTLKYALRSLLAEVLGIDKLKDDSIFDEFKGIKPENCTKEIYNEVISAFKLELKKQKNILKEEKNK